MQHRYLVAFDPALRNCGVAIYHDSWLIACTTVLNRYTRTRGPQVWDGLAKSVHAWVTGRVASGCAYHYATELMEGGRGGATEDLLEIHGVIGAIVGKLQATHPGLWTTYLPKQWKGQVPKPVMLPRIMTRLSPTELAVVARDKPDHNAMDAIGVGLHHQARL